MAQSNETLVVSLHGSLIVSVKTDSALAAPPGEIVLVMMKV